MLLCLYNLHTLFSIIISFKLNKFSFLFYLRKRKKNKNKRKQPTTLLKERFENPNFFQLYNRKKRNNNNKHNEI